MSTAASPPITIKEVFDQLSFARRRIADLLKLNRGDLTGADSIERRHIASEIFFHMGSALESLAQLINDRRGVGIDIDEVALSKIRNHFVKNAPSDPLTSKLQSLYKNPKKEPFPTADPYTDDAFLYRFFNYRHQVTHRCRNPFTFTIPGRTAHFQLDPRDPSIGHSNKAVKEELERMADLIEARCNDIVAVL